MFSTLRILVDHLYSLHLPFSTSISPTGGEVFQVTHLVPVTRKHYNAYKVPWKSALSRGEHSTTWNNDKKALVGMVSEHMTIWFWYQIIFFLRVFLPSEVSHMFKLKDMKNLIITILYQCLSSILFRYRSDALYKKDQVPGYKHFLKGSVRLCKVVEKIF